MTMILGALLGLSIIALIVTVVLFKVFRRCNLETTGEMQFECDVTLLCSRACHYFFCGCSFFALWYRRAFLLEVFLQLPNCHYNGIVKKYFYDGDKTTKNEIEQNRVSRRNSLKILLFLRRFHFVYLIIADFSAGHKHFKSKSCLIDFIVLNTTISCIIFNQWYPQVPKLVSL